jgi:splicing factor 3B subunit 2
MGLSTAERNKRKRERKKQQKSTSVASEPPVLEPADEDNVIVEYVEESVVEGAAADDKENEAYEALRRFQERVAGVLASEADDEAAQAKAIDSEVDNEEYDSDDSENEAPALSNRKLRTLIRPDVATLKRRVNRPDLVEAHDVTAPDPEFLIELKSIPGTVPVPRHWGRKRKYLQGKRGFEKKPFELPDFIIRTGITEMRDATMKEEANMSIRQKNRARVAPKMGGGAGDVDYRTLHDAFFKHQTKPTNLTKLGDLYYEGKELEIDPKKVVLLPGGALSEKLREALGMDDETSPPPWLQNMQRYGPPPSYRHVPIPGLNAPLPHPNCQYGYHAGGWGKPPLDPYGYVQSALGLCSDSTPFSKLVLNSFLYHRRPLYGGNPFDPPGTVARTEFLESNFPPEGLVSSAGRMIHKRAWGALPGEASALPEDDAEEAESSSEEDGSVEMEESDDEQVTGGTATVGLESVLPPPPGVVATSAVLRKQQDLEAPSAQGATAKQKQLYQVLEQQTDSASLNQSGVVFASDSKYVLPAGPSFADNGGIASVMPVGGVESVLAKSRRPGVSESKDGDVGEDEDDDDQNDTLGKSFKF